MTPATAPQGRTLRPATTAWRSDDTRWKLVRGRLVECARVDIATSGRIGPKMFGNAMPEYALEYPRQARVRARTQVTMRDATLADQCRFWPAKFVTDESDRTWLQLYVTSKVTHLSFAGVCEHEEVSRHLALDVVERACRTIVAGLDLEQKVIE